MEISYLGGSCFRIAAKGVNIILDPPAANSGINISKQAAELITVSKHDPLHAGIEMVREGAIVFDTPGEYEAKGVNILGIAAGESVLYTIAAEDMRVAHLGALARGLLDEEVEALGDVDILLLPVGGAGMLTAEKAADLVSNIEPKMVVPFGFRRADDIVKELGLAPKKETKLKINKSQLPVEDMELILLERAS